MIMARLVALLLLLVPATGSAECAWGRWAVQGDKVDHFSASYTSSQECIRELDHREQRARADGGFFTSRSAKTTLFIMDKVKASFSVTYHCLPDTVDPRGPKGK